MAVTMFKVVPKGCGHCGGDLCEEWDSYVSYLRCIQCAREAVGSLRAVERGPLSGTGAALRDRVMREIREERRARRLTPAAVRALSLWREGKSYPRVAAEMGLTERQARWLIQRALEATSA